MRMKLCDDCLTAEVPMGVSTCDDCPGESGEYCRGCDEPVPFGWELTHCAHCISVFKFFAVAAGAWLAAVTAILLL